MLRARYQVPLPGHAALGLGERTLVMGVLNVTPDSFSDGGVRFDSSRAIEDGLRMLAEGADIIDVGGESTRPGAEGLSAAEEMKRVLPIIEPLVSRGAIVSIDTYKAMVAREAIARGAVIVNDISGFLFDPDLPAVVAETGAAVVLMHNRERSREMYRAAVYDDVVAEVTHELSLAIDRAASAGVPRQSIIVDPGLGFSKRAEHSYAILGSLETLRQLDRPILCGASRKSFLTAAIGAKEPLQREWATAAAVTASVLLGAHIVRVHQVAEMIDVVKVADRLFIRPSDKLSPA
jgi:dihydropteroate synthase